MIFRGLVRMGEDMSDPAWKKEAYCFALYTGSDYEIAKQYQGVSGHFSLGIKACLLPYLFDKKWGGASIQNAMYIANDASKEIVAHECVHAACAYFRSRSRLKIGTYLNNGDVFGEELFAHAFSDIYGKVNVLLEKHVSIIRT